MNELENGMVSGAMPYTNPYADYPKRELYMCQCCERDVSDEEIVYRRDYDKYSHDWICAECFMVEVQKMSPDEIAAKLDYLNDPAPMPFEADECPENNEDWEGGL